MELGLDHRTVLKDARRQMVRTVAANQDLHRVLFHLVAHPVDFALGHHIAVVQKHHRVGHHVDFVQDVAGNN